MELKDSICTAAVGSAYRVRRLQSLLDKKSGTLEIVLCAIFRDAMSCGDLAWAADVDELIE